MKKRKANRSIKVNTLRNWLSQLPEPYQSKAIGYTKKGDLDKIQGKNCKSIADALFSAFLFEGTIEGGDYWYDLYKSLKH